MSTPSLKSAYKTLSKASKIKVGDSVTIIATAESNQMGWNNLWVDDMDDFVGMRGTVRHIDIGEGFDVVFDSGNPSTCDESWRFPFFVLRREKPAVKVVKLANGTAKVQRFDGKYKVTNVSFELTVEDLDVLSKAVRKFQKEVESFKA